MVKRFYKHKYKFVNHDKYYETVPFDEIWNVLEKSVKLPRHLLPGYPYGPNPDTINNLLLSMKVNFDTYFVENWEAYETGIIDYTQKFFQDLLFSENYPNFDNIYIILNKSFSTKTIFKVKGVNLNDFIDKAETLIGSTLFQGSDVIFLSEKPLALSFISHTGLYLPLIEIE